MQSGPGGGQESAAQQQQQVRHQPVTQAPSPALVRQEAEGGLLLIQGLVRSCRGARACCRCLASPALDSWAWLQQASEICAQG